MYISIPLMYKLWKKGGIYYISSFIQLTSLSCSSMRVEILYLWMKLHVMVRCCVCGDVWCELWAWWTWGHLPNCHNLLSLIDFQLSLKSSKQSTSDLTTPPTPTQSSHLSSFLQRIFPQQLIDIYWLAGLVSPVHGAQGRHYCCMKCKPLGLKIILMR